MKLIIQIPCYNEEQSLPVVLRQLPRQVPGFDQVEWLVVDDGSRDGTARVARELGVDHLVRFNKNQGLARAFMAGLDAALAHGADVIVNTDADNQYRAEDIPALVQPVLTAGADIVIGTRPIGEIAHFSPAKKMLQKFGSWVVRRVSRTDVPDAPSGFRAFSRTAAMQINVFNSYTYTLETIIQAGIKNMAIAAVPVGVNQVLRPSRLIKNVFGYIRLSALTIVRLFAVYQPFRFFAAIGSVCLALGTTLLVRFLYYYVVQHGAGHIQSLVIASIFMAIGFQTLLVAFLADLIGVNRKLMEDVQYRLKRLDMRK
jgi:glycosyltransferase involved in cell wall biosynthesis